jgi:hypothetical protein
MTRGCFLLLEIEAASPNLMILLMEKSKPKAELDELLKTAALTITALDAQSEKFGGTEHTLWLRLALHLSATQTLDRLVGAANDARVVAKKATKTPKVVHAADYATRNSTGGYSFDVSQMILDKEKATNAPKVTGIKLMSDANKKNTLKALSGK